MNIQRIRIDPHPFLPVQEGKPWREQGLWPAYWIGCKETALPLVAAFRLPFHLDHDASFRIHVSADERYELYLDGQLAGRGPERGDPFHWFYESFQINLPAGDHLFAARVWALGEQAAEYQMSVQPGFLLAAEGELNEQLSTGLAPWQGRRLPGIEFINPSPAHWRDWRTRLVGLTYPQDADLWQLPAEPSADWQIAPRTEQAMSRLVNWSFYHQHRLVPATLPAMLDEPVQVGTVRHLEEVERWDTLSLPVKSANHLPWEAQRWQLLLEGRGEVVVGERSRCRAIIDLGNYYCAFPHLWISGGAGGRVRVSWAESLFIQPDALSAEKGNRDEIEGKYFGGIADEFLPDGSRREYTPLWWQAGRYLEVTVETAKEPLTIHDFCLHETRYPIEMQSEFHCSDTRLNQTVPMLVRGVQACSRDSFFDTPYYEEHTYAGDVRLEALATYMLARDDRLPRKVLKMFDASRAWDGLTQSRYPCRVTQFIPAWSLWWVASLHEYAYWRGDNAYVRALMPGVRQTLAAFSRHMSADGLLLAPEGWNNLDWSPAWSENGGMPPNAIHGPNGTLNWQLAYVLRLASQLEDLYGEPEMAAYDLRWAHTLAQSQLATFWNEERGLFADDPHQTCFSEHAQALAILSGLLDPALQARVARGLVQSQDLDQASYHFVHYIIEALRVEGYEQEVVNRLLWWYDRMVAKGLKTPLEAFEPSRSDCHGWSAHPLYHYFATLLGIRPLAEGLGRVEITPLLGDLTSAFGRLVHPAGGFIEVEVERQDGALHGRVCLPPGISGVLRVNGQRIDLAEGARTF